MRKLRPAVMAACGVVLALAGNVATSTIDVPDQATPWLWTAVALLGLAAVADALRPRLPRWGFAARHRAYVVEWTRRLDTRGLAVTPAHPVDLDAVYVDVSVSPRSPQQVGERGERRSLSSFLGERSALVLVGLPGSGKTTLLRHVARTVATAGGTPVLLELRRHADTLAQNPTVSLDRLWRDSLGDLATSAPDRWLPRRLHRGRCTVLIDGLDEAVAVAGDSAVRDWAQQQIALYPRNDFVLTSRPQSYERMALPNVTHLEVRDLTGEQIRAFVHSMTAALGSTDADDLVATLHERPDLAEFRGNPLLLTMIVLAHRHGYPLPASRAILFTQVCTSVLARRAGTSVLVKERALAALAHRMMDGGHTEIDRSASAVDDDLLTELGSSGLLLEVGHHRFAFAHRTLQEFLAARHIATESLEPALLTVLTDPAWRETVTLYAGLADPRNVLTACLDAGTVEALDIAFDIADTAPDDLRARLDTTTAAAYEPDADPAVRGLIAQVLLRRHLRTSIPAWDDWRMCPTPVSQELYALFLLDTGHPAPDLPVGGAGCREPVSGVWPDDAEAFATWARGIMADRGALVVGASLSHVLSLAPGSVRSQYRFWPHFDETDRRCGPRGTPAPYLITPEEFFRESDRAAIIDLLPRLLQLHAIGLCDAMFAALRLGSPHRLPACVSGILTAISAMAESAPALWSGPAGYQARLAVTAEDCLRLRDTLAQDVVGEGPFSAIGPHLVDGGTFSRYVEEALLRDTFLDVEELVSEALGDCTVSQSVRGAPISGPIWRTLWYSWCAMGTDDALVVHTLHKIDVRPFDRPPITGVLNDVAASAAEPVLSRSGRIDPRDASIARVASIAAHQSLVPHYPEIRGRMRARAAMVTVVEDRAAGRLDTVDTVFLGTD